jgi:hypothetical protein
VAASLVLATLCAAAVQLFEHVPLSPWEPSIAMEAMRFKEGLPVYETGHATHLYGPLLTVLVAGVFQISGLNLPAARAVMSIFAFALAIVLSPILCQRQSRGYWALAALFFLGINFRTNLIVFSIQPDWAAAFLAIVALYVWIIGKRSLLLSFVSVALFLCAMLFKQTAAAVAAIPILYVLLWKRPLQLPLLALSLLPTLSILLALTAICLLRPEMFSALITIPASIKVYPERALNVTLYLFATFPVFLVAVWSAFKARRPIAETERWIVSALIVLVPVSIWTTCKSGSGYNSLLFAYLAMTALFVARLDAIFGWLRSLSSHRSFVAAIVVASVILVSFFLQLNRAVALLSVRHGDDKYDAAVAVARNLKGVVSAPQDPTIAYRANHYFGRSLYFELDTHAVNGNWPNELPSSIEEELARAKYVVEVKSYVPTPVFERGLERDGFHPMTVKELSDSVYTLWSRGGD